jgi:hypothetical protein
MSTRKTFCAAGAVAVNVIDAHATVVMLIASASDQTQIDPSKLVSLDLARRLKNTDWDNVIIDTLGLHSNGNDKEPAAEYAPEDGIDVLTVGPVFPGQTVGGIYFEHNLFYEKIRPVFDPEATRWPDSDGHTYQFMTSATNANDRYHGFHAKVVEDHGAMKLLAIKNRGVTKKINVNMNDRSQCDDPAALKSEIQDPAQPDNVESVLDAGSKLNEEGAVFLPLVTCVDNSLFSPKEPRGADGFLRLARGTVSQAPPFDNTTILVGDPENDGFTSSVFSSLNKATKICFKPNDLNRVRKQLIEVASRAKVGASLDIIADAPLHIQRIGGNMVGVIFDDAWSHLDDDLVQQLRAKFAQCRLLGCFTAGDIDVRRGMLRLASVLRMPVIGTLRAIAAGDFSEMGFRETQIIHRVAMKITLSTAEMMPSGRHVDPKVEQLIESGAIQRDWLTTFPMVRLTPFDLVTEPDASIPVLRVSEDFFGSPMASTDDIRTAPIGVIALETPDKRRVRAEVLAGGTLLRLAAKGRPSVYVSVPHGHLLMPQVMSLLT